MAEPEQQPEDQKSVAAAFEGRTADGRFAPGNRLGDGTHREPDRSPRKSVLRRSCCRPSPAPSTAARARVANS